MASAHHCGPLRTGFQEAAEQRGTARVLWPFRDDHPQHEPARAEMTEGRGRRRGRHFRDQGGKEAAFRFANALCLIDISNNLGDAKSLVTPPATTTHQCLSPHARRARGITDGTLRLLGGLENASDLCEDIAQALTHI